MALLTQKTSSSDLVFFVMSYLYICISIDVYVYIYFAFHQRKVSTIICLCMRSSIVNVV